MASKYTPEFIEKVLADRDRGFTRPQLAEKYEVHVETVERWEKKRAAKKSEIMSGQIGPADLIKLGGEAPPEIAGILQQAVSQMPTGTPEELIRAALMQKFAVALEKAKVPTIKTIKDFKDVVAMVKGIMDIGKPAGKGSKNVDVTVRLDRLGMKPLGLEVMEAEVIPDEEPE